jgi:hypothetical protein
MSISSFANKKELQFVIALGDGFFEPSDGNITALLNDQITLQGFRASVDIDKAGGNQMGTLHARIYGVAQQDTNAVTSLLWKPDQYKPNTIVVTAIDGDQQSQVFAGNIVQAWGNYQSQPDVFLEIQAQTAYVNQLRPVAPRSFNGTVDVATIAAQLASAMGYTFENNGVTTPLSNVYLPGTAMDQLKSLVRAAGCNFYLDDTVVAIYPRGTSRAGLIPLISPQSGLVGYPIFDGTGVNFQCLFNPSVRFGGSVQLQTSIPRASGQWAVQCVGHRLESEKPGGAWFSTVKGIVNAVAGFN